MKHKTLAVGIIFLFIASTITPAVISVDEPEKDDEYLEKLAHANYDRYNSVNSKEYNDPLQNVRFDVINMPFYTSTQTVSNDGPMDSAWPMYCHDTKHTSRSPYSTANNPGDEKWRFDLSHVANGDVVIGYDGTIYFGADGLYSLNPDGTLKWEYITHFLVDGAPAIADDGTIYFGIVYGYPDYLYALYSNNGTLKWRSETTGSIFSSPAIGEDGVIYFGSGDNYINALWPNGTLHWKYETGHVVYSSPAIGDDGTVYCGSHDTYLYALYPNNGTLKWRYKTEDWIRTSPCIADDGTIYVVSLDNYLYAINPDGSLKWRTNMGEAGTSPTIGWDGTIYAGYETLHAINPTNGSVKWTFDVGGTMRGGTPCNSIDGTIYFGLSSGGETVAVNPDGTEKWRKYIGECESAPAISEDGTIYVGSSMSPDEGYFYSIGIKDLEVEANGPYFGIVNEPIQFTGSASGGYPPYTYHWDFGDEGTSEEQNPTHEYVNPGNFTVTLTVTDDNNSVAVDTTWALIRESNEPPSTPSIDGETEGNYGEPYDYTFISTDPDEDDIWFYIEWGDGTNSGWLGPYSSGQEITVSHTWDEEDTYTIRAKAKDIFEAESDWGTLEVTMPVNQPVYSFPLLQRLLEWFLWVFSTT